MSDLVPEMTKQEANARLADIISKYQAIKADTLKEAIALADKHGLAFDWDDTYGSTEQRYVSKAAYAEENEENDEDDEDDEDDYGRTFGWQSSSDHC